MTLSPNFAPKTSPTLMLVIVGTTVFCYSFGTVVGGTSTLTF
jgi:hypothetical protein